MVSADFADKVLPNTVSDSLNIMDSEFEIQSIKKRIPITTENDEQTIK